MKKILTVIYRINGIGIRFIKRKIDWLLSFIKIKALCDNSSSFISYGVPFIETSRKYGGSINIGDSFVMNNGMANNQIGFGKTPCVLSATGASILIGNNVGISQTSMVALFSDITIGNDVNIGSGVKIFTSDFHSLNYLYRRTAETDITNVASAPVAIGDDCFIGAGTIILKGVTIGAHTIIGAGSVVTKPIPSDCIAAGNPCKVVRALNN